MVKFVEMNQQLKKYVESSILPRYDSFDKAHRRDHADAVIARSLELAANYGLDEDMVYTVAAYHDAGLAEGRATHHLASGRIIREDAKLREWFSPEQIETMAQAAEDHRASADHEPRSIYGRIVAEADRLIDPEIILRRTVQYGLSNYPELTREGHIRRSLDHLDEKYAEGGYLKLWIPESPNAAKLRELQEMIKDRALIRSIVERIYEEETAR